MKRYTGPEIPGTCERCGNRILTRTAMSTGRQYQVDDAPGKQWHRCQGDAPRKGFRRRYQGELGTRGERPDVQQQETPQEHAPETHSNGSGDLAAQIAKAVAAYMPRQDAKLDENRVREIVRESLTESGALHVQVSVRGSDAPRIDVGRQHAQFPTLLAIMARRLNIMLVGPAGSGKTVACHKAADALGLPFGAMSVGPQTTQSQVFGYMDAHGNYVPTEFYRRYKDGGVFLFDEIDAGNPGVLTSLNQAIENGACAFPSGMVPKHPDFIAVACANTFGTGASREYVGRLQLDAATLDRFVNLQWNYDASLERDIALATFHAAGGQDASVCERWIARVQDAREKASALALRVVISPRASIRGADLLGSGMDEATVADCVLYKGMDAETRRRVS